MIVDTNLFLNVTINMISASRLNFYPRVDKGKQLIQVHWRVNKVAKDFIRIGRLLTSLPKQIKFIVSKPSIFDKLKFQDWTKLSPTKGQVFNRLWFLKVNKELILEGKKQVAKINVKKGVSSLRIIIQDDKYMMIRLIIKVKKG